MIVSACWVCGVVVGNVWGREGDAAAQAFALNWPAPTLSFSQQAPGKETKWTKLERGLSWKMSTIVCVD
jgi:hypothetical protein